MKAKVKDIRSDTVVEDNGHEDVFTYEMLSTVGKEIEVAEFPDYENWFLGIEPNNWFYHRSWLEFPEGETP